MIALMMIAVSVIALLITIADRKVIGRPRPAAGGRS
jgi:hypothetical protein